MEYTVYKYCAMIGCTLVGLQIVLQAMGVFGDTDMEHTSDVDGDGTPDADHVDGHGNIFFGILSFKALTAFAGIFGLVGLIMVKQEVSLAARVGASLASGVAGMFIVGWMMRMLSRLHSEGTVDVRNAVGVTGSVYLRIPESRTGRGKVTVQLQGRSLEYEALTDGDAIETGASVTVLAVEGSETLKVVPYKGGEL